MRGTTEEKFLGLNGVVYIREDDKADRRLSKEKMVSILKQGGNMMYFPEGIWNLSPNQPPEEFESHIFKPECICNYKDVFRFLDRLQPGKENCFLERAKLEYLKLYG